MVENFSLLILLRIRRLWNRSKYSNASTFAAS